MNLKQVLSFVHVHIPYTKIMYYRLILLRKASTVLIIDLEREMVMLSPLMVITQKLHPFHSEAFGVSVWSSFFICTPVLILVQLASACSQYLFFVSLYFRKGQLLFFLKSLHCCHFKMEHIEQDTHISVLPFLTSYWHYLCTLVWLNCQILSVDPGNYCKW